MPSLVRLLSVGACLLVVCARLPVLHDQLVINRAAILLASEVDTSSSMSMSSRVAKIPRLLEPLERKKPSRRNVRRLIGLSFIVQGHTDKAATYFSDAELYDELLDRGTSALAAHKPTAAKMWLRVAADANPANSSAWCALAGASADPNETIALETRATRLDQEWRSESERINCWFDLAVRQFGIGSYTEAMAAFRNIVRMVPASPADRRKISESYRHQAMIVARTQSKSAAWSIFRKARLEDETNPWAIVSDAVNQFELSKNVQDLLTALRHAIAVDPHNGEVIEEVQRLARRYELPLERLTNVKSRSGIGR